MELRRVLKYGLCPNDLNSEVELMKRVLRPAEIGETTGIIQFESLGKLMSGCETVNPISRQFLVGIKPEVTHLFYFQFSSRIAKLEVGETYLKMRGEYYRFHGCLNHNEQNRFLVMYFEFTGATTAPEGQV
jgi:hypothetical protein